MAKILTMAAGLWSGTKSKLGYTLLTMAVEAVLAYFKSAHPDWTLPSAGQILALGGGLIACHTITDVVHLVTDAIKVATEDGVVK